MSDNTIELFPTPEDLTAQNRPYTITYEVGNEVKFVDIEGYLVMNALLITVLADSDTENASIRFTVPTSRLVSVVEVPAVE